jgi:hypothetical protein
MTRNTNNAMRKMAMTGLMLVGMVLGGLGTVGCDQLSADQLAQVAAASGLPSVQLADSGFAAEKSAGTSRIIDNGPPRK